MRLPTAPLLWAFFNTLTAACSTLVYLIVAHEHSWAANFVQLYSTISIVSGWTNTLVYFLAPRSRFLQTRPGALLIFSVAIVLTAGIFRAFFGKTLNADELLFVLTSMVPVLYANAFGIEFYEGNYPWVYKRVVAFNLGLLLAALGALFFTPSEAGLYRWTGLVGLGFLLIWAFDRWNRVDNPEPYRRTIRPWLNPSMPILERTLWDQWALSRLGALDWSIWIYAVSRVVTFLGNVSNSYILGTNSAAYRRRDSRRPFYVVLFLSVPVAIAAMRFSWCAFLLGQIFAWSITTLLSSEYSAEGARYKNFLCIWGVDLGWRGLGLFLAANTLQYGRFAAVSGIGGITAVMYFLWKQPAKPFPEKPRTISLPAGSPGIR